MCILALRREFGLGGRGEGGGTNYFNSGTNKLKEKVMNYRELDERIDI